MNRYVIAFAAMAALLPPFAPAQQSPDLRSLARDAGVIFRGTVQKIEPVPPAAAGDVGLVRVTFFVHEALRGATAGEELTISEWNTLWSDGDRYRVGEELLLFFYPPSAELGLTSTVGGARGRISLAASQLTLASVALQLSGEEPLSAPARPLRPVPVRSMGPLRVEVAQ